MQLFQENANCLFVHQIYLARRSPPAERSRRVHVYPSACDRRVAPDKGEREGKGRRERELRSEITSELIDRLVIARARLIARYVKQDNASCALYWYFRSVVALHRVVKTRERRILTAIRSLDLDRGTTR